MKHHARKRAGGTPVIDPYPPGNGSFPVTGRRAMSWIWSTGSPVTGFSGTATITAVTLASLQSFSLDLADTLA